MLPVDPLALQFGFPGAVELLMVFALFFVAWLLVAYWVYNDAQDRHVDSPLLWAAIVFFVGPIGAVLYLLVRAG